MNKKHWGILGIAALALGACGSDASDQSPPKSISLEGKMGTLDTNGESVADLAVAVLSKELGIPESEITVDTVRAVEWRDTSIGCPQPGMAYGQVITPGHKITLRVDGKNHVVNEANGRAFICKTQKGAETPTGKVSLVWGQQAFIARKDLAEKLGVEERAIIIAGASETTFTDSSLGCPDPDVNYEVGDRDGFVLRLRHGSRNYTYHTDMEQVIACPAISED